MNRRSVIIFREFCDSFEIPFIVFLSVVPFMIIASARLPFLVFIYLFLLLNFAAYCLVSAIDKSKTIIKKENKQILNALRGVQ